MYRLLLIIGFLFTRVTAFYFTRTGPQHCACVLTYGGQCRTSCGKGEYILGERPCAHGLYGICCAPALPCSFYGGVCRLKGCDLSREKVYTYDVQCPNPSQLCCLRQAERRSVVTNVLTHPEPTNNFKCGLRPTGAVRILGGAPVTSSCQWPWMTSIKLGTTSDQGPFVCAGVLVSRTKVITTANCVVGRSVFVTVGESNPNFRDEDGEQDINVARINVHPRFNRIIAGTTFQANDIAIIELARPAPLGICVRPACIPSENDLISKHSTCFIAGWGLNTHVGNPSIDGRLFEAPVTVITTAVCSVAFSVVHSNSLPTDKLCTAPFLDQADACPGDNGGMLVCEGHGGVWNLYGVISDNSCSNTLPVLYTRIQSHIPWLSYIM